MSDLPYGTKLAQFWAPNSSAVLWLLFGLAPLFFFETFVHEGLHYITGLISGGSPTLIPFAHFNTELGRNVNGATMEAPGFIATPQIVCLILMALLILVFVLTSPPWRWLRTFLVWWYLGLAIDLLFNTGLGLFGTFRDGTDWAKFATLASSAVASVLSWVILLTILSQLVWIHVSRWHENQPAGRGFFEHRGLAIAFAAISLLALILSLTIDHPAIDRNWWFWAVWVFQLLSFAWYVVYVVWASTR